MLITTVSLVGCNIKVYFIDEERYLTDSDVKGNNLNFLITATIRDHKDSNIIALDWEDESAWPTEIGNYTISINFNTFGTED